MRRLLASASLKADPGNLGIGEERHDEANSQHLQWVAPMNLIQAH
jgi:hypothetical protein